MSITKSVCHARRSTIHTEFKLLEIVCTSKFNGATSFIQRSVNGYLSAIEILKPVNLKKAIRTLEFTNGVVTTVPDPEIMDAIAMVSKNGFGCQMLEIDFVLVIDFLLIVPKDMWLKIQFFLDFKIRIVLANQFPDFGFNFFFLLFGITLVPSFHCSSLQGTWFK